MIKYPDIDPVAVHLGPLQIHWYGLMYILGFLGVWLFLRYRIRHSSFPRGFTEDQLSDLVFYSALGVIIGGRVGYMLFYNWDEFISHPLSLFKIWQGGMAFHGGLVGVMVAIWLYGIKIKKTFLEIGDFIVPAVPIGLATGRLGNFINGELWGRVTDVPWAMVFPNGGDQPRHPSQLYEFGLEGVLLFLILWLYSRSPRPTGSVSGLFLILYGIFRIVIEFFREPDPQIGYLAFGWFTKGMLLSIPMIIAGILMMVYAYKKGLKRCNNI